MANLFIKAELFEEFLVESIMRNIFCEIVSNFGSGLGEDVV